jgi:hypothetical protein
MERMARREACWFTGEFLGFICKCSLFLLHFTLSIFLVVWGRLQLSSLMYRKTVSVVEQRISLKSYFYIYFHLRRL